MGTMSNIEKNESATLNVDVTSSFDAWESDVFHLSDNNRIGIVTLQFNGTSISGAKVQIEQSLDGANFDPVDDTGGNVVEISLNASTTVVNIIDLHAPFIKVVGSEDGSAGTLNNIIILAK